MHLQPTMQIIISSSEIILMRVLLINFLLPFLHFDVSFAQSYSGNIALNKTASQSGTSSASLAVDGNTDTSVSSSCAVSTQQDSGYAWWQVDLGDIYEVTSVTFYRGQFSGVHDYLGDINVFVGEDSVDFSNHSICVSFGSDSGIDFGGSKTFNCSSKAVGRYITVSKTVDTQTLVICEFMATGNYIGYSVQDECLDNNGNCSVYANCNNTDEGYNCTCFDGFVGDGFNCADVNECQYNSGNCNPNADCSNIVGSFNCDCKAGFIGDGLNCSDIDECQKNSGNCSVLATCTNTQGSYYCTCNEGFRGDGLNNCTDINECLDNSAPCGSDAQCTNTPGSFNCTCNKGFIGDKFNCTDVDECQENNGNCSVLATCTNTPGSFYCTCNEGFEGDGLINCTEIDECLISNGGCDEHATCNNTVGSFQCTCQTGYIGDGFSCRDQTAGAGKPTSKCLRRLKRCRICRRLHGKTRCRRRCRCSPDRRTR